MSTSRGPGTVSGACLPSLNIRRDSRGLGPGSGQSLSEEAHDVRSPGKYFCCSLSLRLALLYLCKDCVPGGKNQVTS